MSKRMKLYGIGMLLLAATAAYGQVQVQTTPGDGGPLRFDATGANIFGGAHISNAGLTPALSSCGGGSPAVVGNDQYGTITVGTTATGCVLTFAKAWVAAPSCVLSPSSGVLAAFSYVITTSTITVTQTSSSGNIIQYICFGR